MKSHRTFNHLVWRVNNATMCVVPLPFSHFFVLMENIIFNTHISPSWNYISCTISTSKLKMQTVLLIKQTDCFTVVECKCKQFSVCFYRNLKKKFDILTSMIYPMPFLNETVKFQ